jgi:hypothetical protein
MQMQKFFTLLTLGLSLTLGAAHASDEAGAAQDTKKSCSAQAKEQELTGAKRKAFINACVSGEPVADAPAPAKKKTPQQENMKRCNAEAKTQALKGEERKAFMKDCLSTKK